MHEHDDDAKALMDLVFRYAAERMAMDPPPLDHALPPEELGRLAGQTITPEGLGGEEALRLFVDVLGFVEMGRDKRTYCFFQDTRYGRRLMAESDRLPVIVEAVTDYVARRLVEREKALASDLTPARLGDEPEGKPPAQPVVAPAPTVVDLISTKLPTLASGPSFAPGRRRAKGPTCAPGPT